MHKYDYEKDAEELRRYIEEHLTEDLSASKVAEIMGYSREAFCRLCNIHLEMALSQYVSRRRVLAAALEIDRGLPIQEAAAKYCFATASGFDKAFYKVFDLSPTMYKIRNIKESKIITTKPLKVVVSMALPYKGRTWNPYDDLYRWPNLQCGKLRASEYQYLNRAQKGEIAFWEDYSAKGSGQAFCFGPIVEDFDYIPEGMAAKELPAATYAVFTTYPVNIAKSKIQFRDSLEFTWAFINGARHDLHYDTDTTKPRFELYPHPDKLRRQKRKLGVVYLYLPLRAKPIVPYYFK